MLPDVDSLKHRMSLIAYDSGLANGADTKAAALGVQAIEVRPIHARAPPESR